MKKVLFIMESLRGGGAEKALVELLKRFDYTRYRVTLYLIYPEGVYLKEIPVEVEIIASFSKKRPYFQRSIERKCLRHYRKYNREWPLRFVIYRTLKLRKFDTIISYMEGYSTIFHHLIRKRAKKNISWIHCDLKSFHWTLPQYKDASCEKECYEHMDDIVFVSRNSMDAFGDLYPIQTRKHYIYNIIDKYKICALAEQEAIDHSLLTITSIGSLFEVKGYDRLLRVAKKLKNEGYQLRIQILGSGINGGEQPLFDLQKELGLQEYVHFLGYKESPFSYLKASDIFVSTSISEGLSFVICESLVLGTPIVATRTAGAMELLGDDEYGLLADHDDDSFYKALKRMVDDEQLRKHYQQKSLERARIFDTEQTMNTIYRLL